MTRYLLCRLLWRFKFYLLVVGVLLFATQIFMAYKSLNDNQQTNFEINTRSLKLEDLSTTVDDTLHEDSETMVSSLMMVGGDKSRRSIAPLKQEQQYQVAPHHIFEKLDIDTNCSIISKEAISALQRAKTKDCRQYIANVACAIQDGKFYPRRLTSSCPSGDYTANTHLGCFQDEKEYRLLSGYFVQFKTQNTPELCLEICLQSGYPYAGVEYSVECFCGNEPPTKSRKISDIKCNMKCSGDKTLFCGGYYAINIYETGIKSRYSTTTCKLRIFLYNQYILFFCRIFCSIGCFRKSIALDTKYTNCIPFNFKWSSLETNTSFIEEYLCFETYILYTY